MGAFGEIVMLCGGIYIGKELYYAAVLLFIARVGIKILMSHFMYCRMQATIREEGKYG